MKLWRSTRFPPSLLLFCYRSIASNVVVFSPFLFLFFSFHFHFFIFFFSLLLLFCYLCFLSLFDRCSCVFVSRFSASFPPSPRSWHGRESQNGQWKWSTLRFSRLARPFGSLDNRYQRIIRENGTQVRAEKQLKATRHGRVTGSHFRNTRWGTEATLTAGAHVDGRSSTIQKCKLHKVQQPYVRYRSITLDPFFSVLSTRKYLLRRVVEINCTARWQISGGSLGFYEEGWVVWRKLFLGLFGVIWCWILEEMTYFTF